MIARIREWSHPPLGWREWISSGWGGALVVIWAHEYSVQYRLNMVITRALESADKTQRNLIQAHKLVLDTATERARSVSCACATLHDAEISRSPRADYEWAPFKHVFFGWQTVFLFGTPDPDLSACSSL